MLKTWTFWTFLTLYLFMLMESCPASTMFMKCFFFRRRLLSSTSRRLLFLGTPKIHYSYFFLMGTRLVSTHFWNSLTIDDVVSRTRRLIEEPWYRYQHSTCFPRPPTQHVFRTALFLMFSSDRQSFVYMCMCVRFFVQQNAALMDFYYRYKIVVCGDSLNGYISLKWVLSLG